MLTFLNKPLWCNGETVGFRFVGLYNSFHEDMGKISLNRGQVVRASVHGSEGRGFDPARGKNFSFGRNLLKIFALPFFDAGNPFLMEFGPVFR